MPKTTCPLCGSKKSEQAKRGNRRCLGCGGEYDAKPNEGGPQFSDPVRNAEAKEETALRDRRERRMR